VLKRLAQTREEHEAATIGALLGSIPSARAFEFATRTFCVIDSTKLTLSDLSGGFIHVTVEGEVPNNPAPKADRRTRRVELGECDAFISHSWRDPALEKWEALTRFSQEFQRQMGRRATYWMDIVCIDEQCIGESLAALPIYLAGCHQLLCLFGKTFPSRLWCVIELYAFLKMGASLERVRIRPLGELTMVQALEMARKVDVRNANASTRATGSASAPSWKRASARSQSSIERSAASSWRVSNRRVSNKRHLTMWRVGTDQSQGLGIPWAQRRQGRFRCTLDGHGALALIPLSLVCSPSPPLPLSLPRFLFLSLFSPCLPLPLSLMLSLSFPRSLLLASAPSLCLEQGTTVRPRHDLYSGTHAR